MKKLIYWIKLFFTNCGNKTYFPECSRKNKIQKFFDNVIWIIMNFSINTFYLSCGLDCKGSVQSEYLSEREYWKTLKRKNGKNKEYNSWILLRDKLRFFNVLRFNDVCTPSVYAIIYNHKIYNINLSSQLNLLKNDVIKFPVIIKESTGECASFVRKCETLNQLYDVINDTKNGYIYLCQECISQNSEMNKINSNAVNTIRIITVKNGFDNEPIVFSSLLRTGNKSTGCVDNWAAGGLVIGINNDGRLKKYGFYKPKYGGKVERHPDTNILFEGFKIPYYEEAKQLVVDSHNLFYDLFAIGWDIAITENGPVILEGNDNCEISLHQITDRPLKKEWRALTND